MKQQQIRRIVVVNRDKRLAGMRAQDPPAAKSRSLSGVRPDLIIPPGANRK